MKPDIQNILKIIEYCGDIHSYIETYGSDEEDFKVNRCFQHSCAFCLTQIGEIVKKLSSELKFEFSDVKWKQIAGLRDVISHGYGGIDFNSIWVAIMEDIPILKIKCEEIVEELEKKTLP